jgi:ribonuclease Z
MTHSTEPLAFGHWAKLIVGGMTVEGVSTAGVQTSFRLPELGVCIDIGTCPPGHAAMNDLLLTHGHPDHCGSLLHYLGLRKLQGMLGGRIFAPTEILPELAALVAAGERLQRQSFDVELIGVSPGQSVPLRRRNLFARAFANNHVVPGVGWTVVEQRHALRPELSHLSGPEIAELRKCGQEVTHSREVPLVTYVGDTRPDVLEREPLVRQSTVLLMECTFLDDRRGLDAARAGGHTHLRELAELAPLLTNEHVVLVHLSMRYRASEVLELVRAAFPPELLARTTLFTQSRPKSARHTSSGGGHAP